MLSHFRYTIFIPCLVVLLTSCGSMERREAVPAVDVFRTEIKGVPNARFYPMEGVEKISSEFLSALDREQKLLKGDQKLSDAVFLAISGGGDNGAFGAGLLNGWTAAGTRPQFKLVTGVSTGALIAPFAFLGPDYDDQLNEVYTTISINDIVDKRPIMTVLSSDGLADTTPLYELISRYIDDEFLAAVASEYQRGRLLFVATTNLDAQQPVIWNLGAIAAANTEETGDLFRRLMLASASIPGAFSPQMIDVELDGKIYHEMHVDGGTMAQVFVYPPAMGDIVRAQGLADIRKRQAFIIRNARLDSHWAAVERNTLSITGRAIGTLIHSQGIGDLYRIYLSCTEDGVDYNLAHIGSDFGVEHIEQFETGYMNQLYDYGYQKALEGYHWQKRPPGR
jgi:hypothetical protein